jgi:hypothetical protein
MLQNFQVLPSGCEIKVVEEEEKKKKKVIQNVSAEAIPVSED